MLDLVLPFRQEDLVALVDRAVPMLRLLLLVLRTENEVFARLVFGDFEEPRPIGYRLRHDDLNEVLLGGVLVYRVLVAVRDHVEARLEGLRLGGFVDELLVFGGVVRGLGEDVVFYGGGTAFRRVGEDVRGRFLEVRDAFGLFGSHRTSVLVGDGEFVETLYEFAA